MLGDMSARRNDGDGKCADPALAAFIKTDKLQSVGRRFAVRHQTLSSSSAHIDIRLGEGDEGNKSPARALGEGRAAVGEGVPVG
jgi:hypothetical protein